MSDIVTRLRNTPMLRSDVANGGLCREAADEIEHLRQLVALAQELEREQSAEIDRLRDHMRALANTGVDRDTAGIFKGLWQGSEKECDELRAEIERLTAALQEIVTRHDEADDGCYAGQLADMARRALEPKT